MKRVIRRYRSITGLVAIMFIVLVSALGYTYVLNYKARVASAPAQQSQTIAAENTEVPEINETNDLDAALATLDAASVDSLSEADLQALEYDLNSL